MSEEEDFDLHVPGAYMHLPVQESPSYLARLFPRLSSLMSLNLLAITLDSSRTHGNHFQGSVNGYIGNAENGQHAIAYSAQQTTVRHDAPRSLEVDPNSNADYDIYYYQLLLRKRGCPLYLPGPLQTLPVEYRRTGTRIGDIGIIYRTGFFDYLFNILHPADHPINSGRVPDGFNHFDFAPGVTRRHVAAGQAFDPGSYLASACMRKRSSSDGGQSDSDFIFETTENEGAVLVLPSGSKFEDLLSKGCLNAYIADNADQWYSFIRGTCGRVGVRNGDVRLVVGFDKAHSWGIATFACSQEPGRLEFKRQTPSGSFAYTWHCREGIGNGKSGPPDDEIHDLRQTTDEPPPQNQSIFIRTMNFTLRGEIPDDPDSTALQVRPSASRTDGPTKRDSPRPASGSQSKADVGGPQVGQQRGVNFHLSPFELPVIHPSEYLNQSLLDKYPNAKIAITDDWDWISVIGEDDLAFRNPKDLCQRLIESRQVSEANGIVTLSASTTSIRNDLLTQPTVDDPRRDKDVCSIYHTSERLLSMGPACADDPSPLVIKKLIRFRRVLLSLAAVLSLLSALDCAFKLYRLYSPTKPSPFNGGQGHCTSPWQNISEMEEAVFDRLAKEATRGYALSSFMQDAQTGISKLADDIQASDFAQKALLAEIMAQLSANAKETEKGLHTFSKTVDGAFDRAVTTRGWAINTIENAHPQRLYVFMPWRQAKSDVVARIFGDTIDIMKDSVENLILEANRNSIDLQGMFNSIDAFGEILGRQRNHFVAASFHQQFDVDQASILFNFLKVLGERCEERREHIHSSLFILRELTREVEVLREKATEENLLLLLPAREHIKSIAEGLERLKQRQISAQQEKVKAT